MKIKNQNEVLLTPSRMAIMKNVDDNIIGKDMEKVWTSSIAGGSGKWCSHCGKQPGSFSERQTQNQRVYVCFLLSRVWFFATPWTVAHQAPLSMGFFQGRILEQVAISSSRGSSQPGDLPSPEIQPKSLASPALAGRFFTTRLLGSPMESNVTEQFRS